MIRYICKKCGRHSYSNAGPEVSNDDKCPYPGCGGRVIPNPGSPAAASGREAMVSRRDLLLTLLCLLICLATSVAAYMLVGPETPVLSQAEPPEWVTAAAPAVDEPSPEPEEDYYPLTDAQRETIARIVWGEARGEEPAGQIAVADVVLNRLLDGRFGGSVEAVCTADQFHGLRYSDEVGEQAYQVVDAVFGAGEVGAAAGALYFCSGDPDAIKPGLTETVRIGRHIFYTDREAQE